MLEISLGKKRHQSDVIRSHILTLFLAHLTFNLPKVQSKLCCKNTDKLQFYVLHGVAGWCKIILSKVKRWGGRRGHQLRLLKTYLISRQISQNAMSDNVYNLSILNNIYKTCHFSYLSVYQKPWLQTCRIISKVSASD